YNTTSPGTGSQMTLTPAYYWNGGNINANPANGGDGSWGTANAWRQPDASGSQATWSDNNSAIFGGNSGKVVLDANRVATSILFNTDGYILATGSSTFGITGPVTLGNNVGLTLAPNDGNSTSGTINLGGSVSGTGTASITIKGQQAANAGARVNLSS